MRASARIRHERELCAVGYQNKLPGRLLARWAWCAARIEAAEAARGVRYSWLLQARPDLQWLCPVLQSLMIPGAVVVQEDWLWLAERQVAGELLRLETRSCAKSCNHHFACLDHAVVGQCGSVIEPQPLSYSRNLTLRNKRPLALDIASPWRHKARGFRRGSASEPDSSLGVYLAPAFARGCRTPCTPAQGSSDAFASCLAGRHNNN